MDTITQPLVSPSGAARNEKEPRHNIIREVCIYILVMEAAERLCFYTFTGSMIVYLRDYLGYGQSQASAMFSVFNSLVYLTPLIGGYVADAHWGRYKTIAVFGTFYMIGTMFMCVSSFPNHENSALFMLGFFGFVALGAGGIKSNVITMGGDQFDLDIPEESTQKDTYFQYFYWCINLGALFSYFVMAQMATEPEEFGLPQGSGFFATFAIAAVSLTVALGAFFSATNRYIMKPPSGSATADYCLAVWHTASLSSANTTAATMTSTTTTTTTANNNNNSNSLSTRGGGCGGAMTGQPVNGRASEGYRNSASSRGRVSSSSSSHASPPAAAGSDSMASHRPSELANATEGRGSHGESSNSGRLPAVCLVCGTALLSAGVVAGIAQPFLSQGRAQTDLSFAASALAVLALVFVCAPTVGMPQWMNGKGKGGGKAAMLATRMIPVLFNTVSFQVVYAAMSYFSLSACQMDVTVNLFGASGERSSTGNGKGLSFQINGSMLNAADCIAIIVVVPLLDGFAYPKIQGLLGRKIKSTEKYMVGLFVGILAMCSAAALEVARRHAPIVPGCGAGVTAAAANAPTPSPTNQDLLDDGFYADRDQCYSTCSYPGVPMSDFSVWWMAVPYFLVGTGECLCNIPIFELCYSQTPPQYRSMAQAVFLFITAVGSMLTGAFTTSLGAYVTNDLNDGHLEYFYYACIAFCLVLVPVNLWCFALFQELDEFEIEALGLLPPDDGIGGGEEDGVIHDEGGESRRSLKALRRSVEGGGRGSVGVRDVENVLGLFRDSAGAESASSGVSGGEAGVGGLASSSSGPKSDRGSLLRHRPSGGASAGRSLVGNAYGSAGRYSAGGAGSGSIIMS